MPSRWVVKSETAAKSYKCPPTKYNGEALRTTPFKESNHYPKSYYPKRNMVPKEDTNGPLDTEALRTLPFKEVDDSAKSSIGLNGPYDEEALRTMPFKEVESFDDDSLKGSTVPNQDTNGLSDDEDAMSTSAGSSDLGLAESHGSSFAEVEEEEHNSNSQEIPRALLLCYRKHVPLTPAPDYGLRTKHVSECDPVEPEVLLPPGIFPPPGLEDNFDPSQFPMFRAVASDTEELQSLLAKISLQLDDMDTSSTATVSQQEQPLEDWIFESLPETTAYWGKCEVKDGAYKHLWETHTEEGADDDCVSEWLANLATTPLFSTMSAQDEIEDCVDFSALFKTGWEMHAGADPSFNMAAASELMAWPQGYEGLCESWLQHGAVAQGSLAWFPAPWSTFDGQWGPSCANDF